MAGRPTKFKKDYIEQVEKLCLLGATDEQLADFFNVAVSTIYLWRKESKEFSEATKRGKAVADSTVAQALFKRATGYEHEAVKIMQNEGCVIVEPYTERYPPDPASMIFWLKNRQPKLWRDKISQEMTGADGEPLIPKSIEIRGYDPSKGNNAQAPSM